MRTWLLWPRLRASNSPSSRYSDATSVACTARRARRGAMRCGSSNMLTTPSKPPGAASRSPVRVRRRLTEKNSESSGRPTCVPLTCIVGASSECNARKTARSAPGRPVRGTGKTFELASTRPVLSMTKLPSASGISATSICISRCSSASRARTSSSGRPAVRLFMRSARTAWALRTRSAYSATASLPRWSSCVVDRHLCSQCSRALTASSPSGSTTEQATRNALRRLGRLLRAAGLAISAPVVTASRLARKSVPMTANSRP